MKKLTTFSIVALLFTGCAFQRVTENGTNPVTQLAEKSTYVGLSCFNKTALEGLTVGKRTATTSTTFSLTKGSTETQAEALKAAGEAIGAGIASGVKKGISP